ncbi:MAG: hypothetical protein NTU53_13350 [Planctomycetota bacterium]|nr:hypothetical protein [Planctomycetota bacterium]
MTAEIAVMNREAIALAADSAVTMHDEHGEKVFLTANKIFALSKREPVAAMIYGGAAMMGVPWEPAIKVFRQELGDTALPTVRKYAERLLRFLETHRGFFPDEQSEHFYRDHVAMILYFMRQTIEERKRRRTNATETESPDPEDVKVIIAVYRRFWRRAPYIPRTGPRFLAHVKQKSGQAIDQLVKQIFDGVKLAKAMVRDLSEICALSLVKCPLNFTWPSATGLVIAGFGTKELFPSMIAYTLHGIFHKRLHHRRDLMESMDGNTSASIVPFAQSEMVYAFMEGVDPTYQCEIEEDMSMLLSKYPGLVLDSCKFLRKADRDRIKAEFQSTARDIAKQYKAGLEEYRNKHFARPVVRLVSMLPKSELGPLAESMVNLTSLRRRISMEAETVGGPIDVAMISKGDGLIWIKRKHYFDPALNNQFFANYYRVQ